MRQMTDRKLIRLIREARRYFEDFPIDWMMVGEGHAIIADGRMDLEIDEGDKEIQVEWTMPNSDSKIVLPGVWWDENTGAIIQGGTQAGDLVA